MLARLKETISKWASRWKVRLGGFADVKSRLVGLVKRSYSSIRPRAGDDVAEVTPDDAAKPRDPITDEAAGSDTGDVETTETPDAEPADESDEPKDEIPVVEASGTDTAEDAEPGDAPPDDNPLEGIASELHRGVEAGIERILSLFPATGNDSDAQNVLDSVRTAASSNIPQPPTAAQAVLSLCQRRDYSLHELTELIERDPSLSAALLRHANSAWYASSDSRQVLGLRAAVHRVGTQGVHAAVMSRMVEGALSRPGPKFTPPARMVWRHMIRVAPIARELATLFGVDTNFAFSLGLLHDVGKLVLFHHISDLRRARRREIVLSDEFLWLALASLHEPLGGLAVLEWGMDERAAHIVAHHHRDPKPEPEDVLTEVVFLAERIDIAEQHGQTLDIEPLWKASGLTGPLPRVKDFVKARIEGDFSSPDSEAGEAQVTEQPSPELRILEEPVGEEAVLDEPVGEEIVLDESVPVEPGG